MSEAEAMRKISSQMPLSIKLKKADIQVDNSGTIAELDKRVVGQIIPAIYQRLGYIDATSSAT